MREILLNVEEEHMTKKSQFGRLLKMLEYIDAYIYLAALAEQYNPDSEIEKVEILEIL